MLNLLGFKPQMKTIRIFQDPAASLPSCHPWSSNRSLHVGDVAGHVIGDELEVGDELDEQLLDDVVDQQLHVGNIVGDELEVGNLVEEQLLDEVVDE